MQDIRRVTALTNVSGEDTTSAAFQQRLCDFETSLEQPQIPSVPPSLPVHCVQVQEMTDEERNMTSFTRRGLKKLRNWADWDAAFDQQLESCRKWCIW